MLLVEQIDSINGTTNEWYELTNQFEDEFGKYYIDGNFNNIPLVCTRYLNIQSKYLIMNKNNTFTIILFYIFLILKLNGNIQ